MELNLKNVLAASVVTGVTVATYVAVPCTGITYALSDRNASDFVRSAAVCSVAGAILGTPFGVGKFAMGATALGLSTLILKGINGTHAAMQKGITTVYLTAKRAF